MNTRYYIILVWAALLMCSTLPTIFAQEVLRPLGGNAELQHRHLWQQLKSSTLGWSCNSETSLNAAAAFDFYEVMRPSCSGTDGSISINFAPNNISAVEITLLNVQSGEVVEQNSINPQIPTHTLSNIAAGVYRLQLSAGGGIFIDEFIFISDINENLGGDLGNNFDIDRDFDVSNERCTVGSIKRTFSAILGTTYSARIYDLHTLESKGTIVLANVGVGEIALPAGDYFLQIKPVAGAGCKAFLPFSIAKEPINFVPFRDDFSNQFATLSRSSIYAQYEKWEIGKQVYVNATLPIDPPTIGVATFDGLDEYGLPYFVSDTLQTGSADTLLSRPFCEFSQYAANPLYMSFFFQAKGNGDIPNPPDSLILELKDNRGIWNKVWEMRGEALQAYLDTFTMVSFRIKDDLISDGGDTATFYADDFQFRFRNKATITGYNDHWHIDYVQITPDSLMQTSLQDVGFIYPAKPMLKHYWAMPWKHFIDNTDTEYSENIQFTLRNNSSVSNGGIQLNLRTSEMCSGMILKDSLYRTAPALEPLIPYIIDYAEVAGGTVPLRRNIVFNDEDFDDRRDVVLRSEYYFDDGSGALDVDQVTQDQIFSNYFAYDDGSAEKAYGLQGASAELAYRFYLNKPDSITGIKVYFTDIVGDLAANRLEFKVWKSIDFEDNPDVSDSTLYVSSEVQYRLSENERDCFAKYDFGTKIPVDSVFYIGFRQIDEDPLNIGFDVNSLGIDTLYIEKIDSITQSGDTIKHTETLYTPLNFGRKNLFYNADGVWRQSIQFGSLMLQPIMANNFNVTYTGNEELPLEQAAETAVRIYPNPTENLLNIQVLSDDFNQYIIKLYDLSGKMHLQAQNESQIYLGDLPDGLYMIEIQSLQQNNAFVRHKIIKH